VEAHFCLAKDNAILTESPEIIAKKVPKNNTELSTKI
jgi:hypothetical protein